MGYFSSFWDTFVFLTTIGMCAFVIIFVVGFGITGGSPAIPLNAF